MKVLLINPAFSCDLVFGNAAGRIGALLPPLGLAYIASILEKNNHEVDIIDGVLLATKFDRGLEYIRDIISKSEASVVGVTATTPQIQAAIDTINMIKTIDPKKITVLGGPHITAVPDTLLAVRSIDYGVWGEGEYSFLEFINKLADGEKPEGTPGIITRNGGRAAFIPRSYQAQIDEIPFPARHLLPFQEYRPAITNYRRLPATQIITSRGCPYHCIFCHKSTTGNVFRAHSPEYVLREIETLIDDYGVKDIQIFDDTFTLDPERVQRICEGIKERKLDIGWNCMTRADRLTPDLLKLMKSAGCYQIGVGIESGSPRILKLIKKGVDKDVLKGAVRMIKAAGIETRCFFMIGLPTETRDEVKMTIDFARELNPQVAQFLIATPYPDTEMWELCRENGVINSSDFSGFTMYRPDCLPFHSDTLAPEELRKLYRSAIITYYLRPRYFFAKLRSIQTWSDIKRHLIAAGTLARL
ncbi:MAG: radical SAM protein [Candidatus Erginobacter occultus]|nr:radical SAM protein [Candidatus Erginobacter occultus]